MKAQAVKFNKTNSDYKIVVKEYADFDGEYNDDAYEAARLKLNQDILSGKKTIRLRGYLLDFYYLGVILMQLVLFIVEVKTEEKRIRLYLWHSNQMKNRSLKLIH